MNLLVPDCLDLSGGGAIRRLSDVINKLKTGSLQRELVLFFPGFLSSP